MTFLKQLFPFSTTVLLALSAVTLAEETVDNPHASAQKQYDFLIGSWSCRYLQYSRDEKSKGKVAAEYPCDWNARYTFDGYMVQDDFRLYYQDKVAFAGTTLRTWVENKKRWDLAFLGAAVGHWPNFHGVWRDNKMEITASGSDRGGDFLSKIRFTDIQENSFLWEMEKSYDEGKTWYLDTQIKTQRKNK